MLFQRIQHRLIFTFVILVITIIIVGGWMMHWVIRQSLEVELGRKLMAVANAASVHFTEEEIKFLMLDPGPRIEQRLHQRLLKLKQTTDVKRIYFFDLQERSVLDTDDKIEQGFSYFNLKFYKREMEDIQNNKSSYSILFKGIDGLPTMTGFAPLIVDNKVVGGIAVDGSATFLGAVNQMRRRFYLFGILGTLAAISLGIILAGTITHPIRKLVRVSKQIGRGDYSDSIPSLGKSEIGLLSKTMEEMRKGVIERERELKAMLAGVAHEIRNPLGGIELFTGLLADEVTDYKDAKSHVERISKEVANLNEIVSSFLTYARPQKPKKETCRISEIISEVNLLVKNQIKKQKITLSIEKDIEKLTVLADPIHLKRIILNIVQNAIQAVSRGGKIQIRWAKNENYISLFFVDNGGGIPKELQGKIFTPFFTTREQGTGLGLSIVKGLLEVNEGSILLKHSDQNGTEFEVQLKTTSKNSLKY